MPQVEDPAGRTAALSIAGVTVRFGGVAALNDVTFEVEPGALTGVIGPNGAGKTTLFNVISGLQIPDSGSVHIFDNDVTTLPPHQRARLGLARTFQRLELFGSLTVRENVQVGLESRLRWWKFHRQPSANMAKPKRIRAADSSRFEALKSPSCEELLVDVGLDAFGSSQSSVLPTGMARMSELARALSIGPKILLLDEPGSGLDEAETQALGHLLSSLAETGMAVVVVEHDIDMVMRICKHICVLDFGERIASGSPDQIRTNPAVRLAYLGDDASSKRPTVDATATSGLPLKNNLLSGADRPLAAKDVDEAQLRPPGIELKNIRAAYGRIEVIHGVDLVISSGSVFMLLGPNGAGKSSLLKVIGGQLRPTSGEVLIGGQPVGKQTPDKLVKSGVCSVPEGRGVFANLTVRENVAMWTSRGGVNIKDAEEATYATFPQLKHRRMRMAGTLSGGEQQMLAISRALVADPKVLLLDELSMGLAPLIVSEIYGVVGSLAAQGVTVILVEQFVTAALGIATQAAVMVHGEIRREGAPQEMVEAALELYI